MKNIRSLRNNIEFQYVYKNGKSYANKYIVLYVVENHQDINRLGITASKKIGNSIVRHHFARLVRESYRLHENMFNSGLDIVVVARKGAADATYHDIEASLLSLGKLQKMIRSVSDDTGNKRSYPFFQVFNEHQL